MGFTNRFDCVVEAEQILTCNRNADQRVLTARSSRILAPKIISKKAWKKATSLSRSCWGDEFWVSTRSTESKWMLQSCRLSELRGCWHRSAVHRCRGRQGVFWNGSLNIDVGEGFVQ